MNNFYIAQIFGIIGIVFSVLSMQMKNKKNIMIMLLCLNLASGLNFLFLESWSGSLVCFFAVLETFINYLFNSKNKKVPIYIVGIYVIVNIALGLSTYHNLIDIIPILCALLYCATVCTKEKSNIRKLMFGNQSFWLIYDLIVEAYLFSISNVLTLVSIIISFIRYDRKNNINSTLNYKEITEDNLLLATNIQLQIFPKECAYNFYKWSIKENCDYIKYYIIYHENIPIGITGLYNYDNFKEKTIWLGWFGILKEYRNNGYGRMALLDTVKMGKELSKKYPINYFRLYTYKKGNYLARTMYDNYMDSKEEYTNKKDYKAADDTCYIYTKSYTSEKEYWNNRYAYINEDIEKEKITEKEREKIINYNEK